MKGRFEVFDSAGNLIGMLDGIFRRDGQGVYRFIGNQRVLLASLVTHMEDFDGLRSELLLEVRDPQNLFGGQGRAVLSGPGIPDTVFYEVINLPRFTQDLGGGDVPDIALTDAQVAQIPPLNAGYHLEVSSATTTLVVSYDLQIGAAPVAPSTLTSAQFISVRSFSPSPASLGEFGGGTITSSWNLPAGMARAQWFFVIFDDGSHRLWVDGGIGADGASGTVTVPAGTFTGWSSPRHGSVGFGGWDCYGREFETGFSF
jgi:hypothetical protein